MSAITFRAIPTTQLVANQANVRDELTGLEELAASIRANGILQPLIVNDHRGRLVVTDGHRRLAAARLAMVPAVPCLVTTGAGSKQVVTTMLATAMHKELSPIEQAKAFDMLRGEGMTVADIARSTGYSQPTIKGRLLLLELPAEAQRMVEDEQLTIGQATDLAKQVRATRSGTTAKKGNRSAWFTKAHRLAATVADRCTHDPATRTHVGAVACGQCWEDAIRADERGELEVVPVYDEVAVQRAMDGRGGSGVPRPDRLEAVRRLHRQGLSDGQIAERLHCTDRQVIRDRQALDLPTNFPEFAHPDQATA